jgi:predicted nucleic acid-binding Zn ribbon protein
MSKLICQACQKEYDKYENFKPVFNLCPSCRNIKNRIKRQTLCPVCNKVHFGRNNRGDGICIDCRIAIRLANPKPKRITYCPVCGKIKNLYRKTCSKRCRNIARKWPQEVKDKISLARLRYFDTPEGMAYREKRRVITTKYNQGGTMNAEVSQADYCVDIPIVFDDVDFDNNFDGWSKGEDW